jgi:hypothetical protein
MNNQQSPQIQQQSESELKSRPASPSKSKRYTHSNNITNLDSHTNISLQTLVLSILKHIFNIITQNIKLILLIIIILFNQERTYKIYFSLLIATQVIKNFKDRLKHNLQLILLIFIVNHLLEVIEVLIKPYLLLILPLYYIVKIIILSFLVINNFKGMNIFYSNLVFYLFVSKDEKDGCSFDVEKYIIENKIKYSSVCTKEEENNDRVKSFDLASVGNAQNESNKIKSE